MLSRIFTFVILASFLCVFSGCAMLLAPSQGDEPDLKKIKIGTPRAIVEAELDKPILEERAAFRSKADRRCVYQYFVREKVPGSEDESFLDKFTAFHKKEVVIEYDFSGLVKTLTVIKKEGNIEGRARLTK